MRRPNRKNAPRLSADSQRLVALARAGSDAASRMEERFWERHLDQVIQKALKASHQDAVDGALDILFGSDLDAYDILLESVEAVSESIQLTHDGVQYDALLISAPILAWTRFSIASGAIPKELQASLSSHLSAQVLAPGSLLALAPLLYSIDQLPRTHAETYALTTRMAQHALSGTEVRQLHGDAETAAFLADTRYLLAVALVPSGAPLFRWQAGTNLTAFEAERESALKHWRAHAAPDLSQLLPGCGIEVLLPEAYYTACREADRQIRPVSIRAAVHFLVHALNVEASTLRAIVAGFGNPEQPEGIEEYRIAFARSNQPDLVYGLIWPLYGQEDLEPELATPTPMPPLAKGAAPSVLENEAPQSSLDEIRSLLKAAGVTHIKVLKERFAIEFCDDCGAPLFADAAGELSHAEMPEDVPAPAAHLH